MSDQAKWGLAVALFALWAGLIVRSCFFGTNSNPLSGTQKAKAMHQSIADALVTLLQEYGRKEGKGVVLITSAGTDLNEQTAALEQVLGEASIPVLQRVDAERVGASTQPDAPPDPGSPNYRTAALKQWITQHKTASAFLSLVGVPEGDPADLGALYSGPPLLCLDASGRDISNWIHARVVPAAYVARRTDIQAHTDWFRMLYQKVTAETVDAIFKN